MVNSQLLSQEFQFLQKAFKLEERKMVDHIRFEEITSKYWQLLRQCNGSDLQKNVISKSVYKQFMQRVYKLLLPIYRPEEMEKEIEEEWIFDSRNQESLDFTLFTKLLYRIAHHWCVHIDLDEYNDLLERIYDRISLKRVVSQDGNHRTVVPAILIEFTNEERKIQEGHAPVTGQGTADEWDECCSDDSNRSDFEYKFVEDQVNMKLKKFKKKKVDPETMASDNEIFEPLVFNEVPQSLNLEKNNIQAGDIVYDVLSDLDYVIPIGFPTEQFIAQLKNDVHEKIEVAKAQAFTQFQHLKREMREKQQEGQKLDYDEMMNVKDTGILNETGKTQVFDVNLDSDNEKMKEIKVQCRITDSLVNKYRHLLRDGLKLKLQLFNQFPKAASRQKSRASHTNNEPITEMSKFEVNPALERRVHYRLVPVVNQKSQKFMNINFIYKTNDYEAARRCDIYKVETREALALKPPTDFIEDEQFLNDTPYKEVRRIMLARKFEGIFQDRLELDNKEMKRLSMFIEKDNKKKFQARKNQMIQQKGVSETYEEKNLIRIMKGPFYQLESRVGIPNDDFYRISEQDVLDAANSLPPQILIIGKPRSGKTTIAADLAAKLGIKHINVDNWITALLEKIKNYEAPDLDPEDENAEPPKWLTDVEEAVNEQLKNGQGVFNDQVEAIIEEQVNSEDAKTRGFILDLTFSRREETWATTIRRKKLLGSTGNYQTPKDFSHVIELDCSDEDAILRASFTKQNPIDGKTYSRWQREERKRKYPKDDEEIEALGLDDEQLEAIKPFEESDLVDRVQDNSAYIKDEISYYNSVERSSMEEILINLNNNQYIKINSGGLPPPTIVDIVTSRIKPENFVPLHPVAIQIENGSDFKSLLTANDKANEEAEFVFPRKYSLWRQTDPVSLFEGKVVPGQPENAATFHNNVFVFSTEENLTKFLAEPKKYLVNPPSMPLEHRVLMIGPDGSGKLEMANKLADFYSWKVVNYKKLINDKIEELNRLEVHIPNNPEGGRIGLKEDELGNINDGKPIDAAKFVPWILDYLGHPLMKKKPVPVEEGQEEQVEEEELDDDTKKKRDIEAKKKQLEEDKKRKEEEEKQRQKEERHKQREQFIEEGKDPVAEGIEDSEEEPPEDLSIDQLVLKEDEETGKVPFVGGFILVNFPETEEQINKLKDHGLDFDRIIYLTDMNEEEPGIDIKKKIETIDELYDWEAENEQASKVLALVKEHISDEIVKEIPCNGSEADVFIRIRAEIDPFFIQADNPDDVRTTAELDEDQKKLPKGDFADFCPVTYVNDNWLIRGNPEFESTVFGRTYLFANEKEQEEFKFNPQKFLVTQFGEQTKQIPLQPPPPKFMIMGVKGAGVSTQVAMICDKYKLEELYLRDEYMKNWETEKEKRRRRRLLDRGFRPPQPVEEEGEEAPVDPEIEDEPDDFDKEAHERDLMRMTLSSDKGLVLDGCWRDIPEEKVQTALPELMTESKRLPEILVILSCKADATFSRKIDHDQVAFDVIQKKSEFAQEQTRKREEEYKAEQERIDEEILAMEDAEEEEKQQKRTEELEAWNEKRDEEDQAEMEAYTEENGLEVVMEKLKTDLTEIRDADIEKNEAFLAAMEGKVKVVQLDTTNLSAEFVNIKINNILKPFIQARKDLIEKELCQTLSLKEVEQYEASFVFKQSKFGINSPINPNNPIKSKDFAVLYRERVYFPANEEERKCLMEEPSKYVFKESIPKDINIKPKIVILGLPKCGKSELAKKLAALTGVVYLKMQHVINEFMDMDCVDSEALRKLTKGEGRALDDETLVNLLQKRLQYKDTFQQGFVLEDFPKTRQQAVLLARKGIVPSNVIYLRTPQENSYQKTGLTKREKFSSDRIILSKRIQYQMAQTPHVMSFYQKYYNNVTDIDGTKSKWSVEDKSLAAIEAFIEARQNFARDFCFRNPPMKAARACVMENLGFDVFIPKQSVSQFGYYCPVSWKNKKLLVKCQAGVQNTVFYKEFFYFFKSKEQRDQFVMNPGRFLFHVNFNMDLPQRLSHHLAAQIIHLEKALDRHCPVSLHDDQEVIKAAGILSAIYGQRKFVFADEHKLQKFLVNPSKFAKITLPVKMPAETNKVTLFNLQKLDDSVVYMEQALASIVNKALREVSENRLKYPGISVKETMLKLFAIYLKAQNPANTQFMKDKYSKKMREFIERCELPEELNDLYDERESQSQWTSYKENYFNETGAHYDQERMLIEKEKSENFIKLMK